MRVAVTFFFAAAVIIAAAIGSPARADSRGDERAQWLNERGRDLWGPPPTKCDDLTFARRVYLDLIGRVPSVAELQDFEAMGDDRRERLIELLVFGEGSRGEEYARLSAEHLARQWRQVLLPAGGENAAMQQIEISLAAKFRDSVPFDRLAHSLISLQDSAAADYYRALGGLPEHYAGNLSRALLGVRIECAQCHDHPFSAWTQEDFWGLAAFYAGRRGMAEDGTRPEPAAPGRIDHEGVIYPAKFLWSSSPLAADAPAAPARLAAWMASEDNPNFSTTAVNRFWQHLVGRGLYADVENLDTADEQGRSFADELGRKFAEDSFRVPPLIAAIMKSDWYQARSDAALDDDETEETLQAGLSSEFYRPTKSVSPEQVFDSLEQSLHLPISRLDPGAPRWTGVRRQWVNRLSESQGDTPEDYSAGIPQALLLMNGRLTRDAVDVDSSRLLRAVLEAPFMGGSERIETLYLAVLTRRPTDEENVALSAMLAAAESPTGERRFMAELLWALINSPEFVLCR